MAPSRWTDLPSDISGTVAGRIEQAIRLDIISGAIAPGARLRTADLSTRYGVSHIPVREALRQLEGDRLVIIESHKGAALRRVDRKFVIDVHDTRQAIETLLVRNATLNATLEELEQLAGLADDYETAASANDQAGMVTANRRFHRFIAKVADNPEAAQILDRGWELVISLTNRFGRGPNRIASIIDEHRRLVQAIQRRDPIQAITVAQEHCESAKEDLLRQMDRTITATQPREKTQA